MKEKIQTDAIIPDGLAIKVFRGKAGFWEFETAALVTDIMDIGFLPDTKLRIEFIVGGDKRRSRFRAEIDREDFPNLLEMMMNIGGAEFRQAVARNALRAIAEHPREFEIIYRDILKKESDNAATDSNQRAYPAIG